MGFEGFSSGKWPVLVKHKRSKSFPDNREAEDNKSIQSAEEAQRPKLDMELDVNGNMKQSSSDEIQRSLRQEILLLEKRLKEQVSVRCALEKALGYKASSIDVTDETMIPKPATELIREISVLELEVGHLEQYLLSLYRKAFDEQVSSYSPSKKDIRKSPLATPRRRRLDFSSSEITSTVEKAADEVETQAAVNMRKGVDFPSEEKVAGVQRSHSSLSQRSAMVNRTTSPEAHTLDKALRACHSQPLSMMEYAGNTSSHVISLAEHLGTRILDDIVESPNKLSEDMVKCMCTIYCKLSDPSLSNNGISSSPSSSFSSGFSPKDQCDIWSPRFRNDSSSFDTRLDNPFLVEGLKDFSGPYSTMIEVNCLYRDSQKYGDIEHLLQNFRSLVSRLEEIDPRKLTTEEKLAFWINVHNSLVMHAILAYGVPQNNMKRTFLLLKAAYNVGGHIVSAGAIQSSILGCRMPRPGQLLRLLLSSKTKFKAGDERLAYAIERPQPLVYFALSCGSHSDPSVRIYSPKGVTQELEAAKEDYIRATFGVRKDRKVLIPKLLESFAKDSGLCHAGLMETVQKSLPDSLRKSVKKRQLGKSRKNIEWISHNYSFRYLISKEAINK